MKGINKEYTFIQMRTIVVCLYTSCNIGGINMECVQVSTDLLDWPKILIDIKIQDRIKVSMGLPTDLA